MHHNFNHLKNKQPNIQSGFGLIELLVSISIVIIVTSVILVKHTSYNGAVLLRSEAYKVALQIREVQLSAVSVIIEANNFRNAFGLYFNTASYPNLYYTFRDANDNTFFDAGENIGKNHNIDARFEIDEIRLMNGLVEVSTQEDIAIIFERPNFDARFFTAPGTEVAANISTIEIDIRLKGASGDTVGEVRTVEVSKTGQITVKPAP
jgi:type II secretory pathway pseudopilin PulG